MITPLILVKDSPNLESIIFLINFISKLNRANILNKYPNHLKMCLYNQHEFIYYINNILTNPLLVVCIVDINWKVDQVI